MIDESYSKNSTLFLFKDGVTHLKNQLNCSSNDQYLTTRHATEKILELGYQRPLMMIPANDDALLEDEFSSGFYSVTRRLAKKQQLDLSI